MQFIQAQSKKTNTL